MKKTLLVFWFEYARRVKTKGFIFAVISMPLVLLLGIGLALVSARMQTNPLPIGFIDLSGFFSSAQIPANDQSPVVPVVDIIPYLDQQEGEKALEKKDIQALFIIPGDYPNNNQIAVLANETPGDNAYSRMRSFVRTQLLISADPQVVERIRQGSDFTVIAFDGSRSANMRDWFVVFFPFLIGLFFIIVINISGGYLMQSVVDEKENRTMEMIVTSVSPEALMAGKILGNLSVGLTQLLIWMIFAWFGIFALEFFFGFGYAPVIMPIHIVLVTGIIIPGFILVAALMTLVGVSAASLREAQQVSVLFTLPMVAPYWFAGAVLQNPSHPLAVTMSIFPLTAVITMPLRTAITDVPAWQIILTVLLMIASAIIALWLTARIFRIGMLNYGKHTSIKRLFMQGRMENK